MKRIRRRPADRCHSTSRVRIATASLLLHGSSGEVCCRRREDLINAIPESPPGGLSAGLLATWRWVPTGYAGESLPYRIRLQVVHLPQIGAPFAQATDPEGDMAYATV